MTRILKGVYNTTTGHNLYTDVTDCPMNENQGLDGNAVL